MANQKPAYRLIERVFGLRFYLNNLPKKLKIPPEALAPLWRPVEPPPEEGA